MGKPTGFKEYDRRVPGYKPVEERTKHYKEFSVPLKKEELQEQGARCMDCGLPFCHSEHGCPLGNIIPEFNDDIYHGRWEKALTTLLSTNNFPEFTGRICPAPCETACVLGINKPPVTIKNIEMSIIENAFEQGWIKPQPPKERTEKKVAVVGSGPAGLAAADQLNKAGHWVTVYERDDRIGGLLRYGIPDFKLSKDVVQRRVDLMEAEGVTFLTNVHVGKTISTDVLLKDFDALVLCGGSTQPRDLDAPGRDATGIYPAMQFLKQSNKRVAGDSVPQEEEILATGKNVLVIGGGDTGSDCIGTSIRQKAKSVTQIEIMERPPEERDDTMPWPLYPRIFRISSSQEEGCERDFAVLTKEFIKDSAGHVKALKCVKIEWDKDMRKGFKEIDGSEFELKAELVLLAMGFLHPEHDGVLGQLDVKKDQRGNVEANSQYQTSVPSVFTAGDMRRGQSLVVWAISEGRECARHVDAFLREAPSFLNAKAQSFYQKTG